VTAAVRPGGLFDRLTTVFVFIGYSLPHADFEFRQLLSRMVNKGSEVHVVLYEDKSKADGSRRYIEECSRYSQFFSRHSSVTFESGGVSAFVSKLPPLAVP